VRELENTIERAVLVCDGGVIHGHHLPPTLQTAEASDTIARQSLAESVEAFERDLLQDALKTSRGSCARAARLLGTTERIFNYKIRKNAVDVNSLQAGAQGGQRGAGPPAGPGGWDIVSLFNHRSTAMTKSQGTVSQAPEIRN